MAELFTTKYEKQMNGVMLWKKNKVKIIRAIITLISTVVVAFIGAK